MAKHDEVELRVGDEHSIELEGLMTAGYVWEPEVVGDESIAEVTKGRGQAGDPGVGVGASPAEVFTIKAIQPGKTRVRFTQRRPWDPAAQSDEHIVDLLVAE
jgi:predicted secreted protein